MKKALFCAAVALASLAGFAQQKPAESNTLLWRISGNGLQKPSYLFGTIHMLCATQLDLSDSLKAAIAGSDQVYLEIDMDNMEELMGVMNKMKMNGDTTLQDLLTAEEYTSVRNFFSQQGTPIPFSMLEKYKPMLAASAIMETDMECPNPVAMEQLIMDNAKTVGKKIRGLETIAFQMSIFDSIPYRIQANQLVKYVKNYGKTDGRKDYEELTSAYLGQDLKKLEAITLKDDMGIANFMDILLYNRNSKWATQLPALMQGRSLVVAVGAGHLPGDRGVISLLRKAGYTVEPVENNMLKKLEKNL
ncbi:MAG: hypothetical protein JWP27_1586 [Flaviaesturariibacter sp.]|nr:hypothetical protein [Flaviaesturariibacter sp.]